MLKNFSDINDENLVKMYRESGKMIYAGELFKRHLIMSYSISYKYLKDVAEAQDAVMNVFEKILTDLKKFEILNFKSWLHSVIRNHCLMLLRKKNINPVSESFDTSDENKIMKLDKYLHQPVEVLLKEKKLEMVEEAINMLNSKQKICIDLFYLKGKSYEEICEFTGFTNNEVKSFIQNGKRNLKIILTEKGIDLMIIIWLTAIV
ncbi:MAG: sigma-70 family RNA polymerase sigma factor [Bacteroidetes bacterium]|nr:sigma-70 family RNA polymerase sigma factor [Bacteroidota bacterium]